MNRQERIKRSVSRKNRPVWEKIEELRKLAEKMRRASLPVHLHKAFKDLV